jgi:hypothetical protein
MFADPLSTGVESYSTPPLMRPVELGSQISSSFVEKTRMQAAV